MRSFAVISGENALAQQFTNLRADAAGGGALLVHQQLGAIALPTNPSNTQTLTLTINGTAITITFVTSIGSTAGNVLIGASAAATVANLVALLNQPQTTTSTGVALSAGNQSLVGYLSWPVAANGTTITPCSNNTALYAPETSFTASTTATGGSYTASTMKLYVEPGVVYVNGTRVIFAGGSTGTFTAPVSNPRIDLVSIDSSGSINLTTGAENASPVAPTYPTNQAVLCEVKHVVGETQLLDNANQASGQGFILNDVRPDYANPMTWTAFTSDLIPDADGTRNLGSGSFEWNNIYVKSGIFLNGQAVTGSLTAILTAGENLTAGQPVLPLLTPANAIAVDTSLNYDISTTNTRSFTVGNNSNRGLLIFAAFNNSTSGTITGVTYAGSSMAQVTVSTGNARGRVYAFYLNAPTTGANNIVITMGSAAACDIFVYSLYNVEQSGEPIASTATTSGTNSFSLSTTNNFSTAFGCHTGTGSFSGNGYTSNVLTDADTISQAGQIGVQTFATTATWTNSGGNDGAAVAISPYIDSGQTVQAYKAGSATSAQSSAFIGFAASTYTAGQSATINVGGVDGNQSGLTVGSQYYLNDTRGTIGTSPGTVTRKVGIPISSTKILVTNVW